MQIPDAGAVSEFQHINYILGALFTLCHEHEKQLAVTLMLLLLCANALSNKGKKVSSVPEVQNNPLHFFEGVPQVYRRTLERGLQRLELSF